MSEQKRITELGLSWDSAAEDATEYGIWLRSQADFICAYCASAVPVSPRSRHVDHINPLSRGGNHACTNIAPACQRCNISKGAKKRNAPIVSEHLTVAAWMRYTCRLVPAIAEEKNIKKKKKQATRTKLYYFDHAQAEAVLAGITTNPARDDDWIS